MLAANICTILLIAAFSIVYFIAIYRGAEFGFLWFVPNYGQLIMLWVFMVTWAWTLILLYRNVKHQEKVLPNKKVFILHGIVLSVYLVIYTTNVALYQKAAFAEEGTKSYAVFFCLACYVNDSQNLVE